jgi:hypothetical protein
MKRAWFVHAAGWGGMAALLSGALVPAARDSGGNGARELTVEILGLTEPVLPSLTPTLTVRALREPGDEVPIALGVRVSLSPLVLGTFVQDTAVDASDQVDIRLTAPLPSGAVVYFRGYARTPSGGIVYSPPSEARAVPQWLRLVSPGSASGAVIEDETPSFVWSGAPVGEPPGPWVYQFRLGFTSGGPPLLDFSTSDTSYAVFFPLELNTSYRWSVRAHLAGRPSSVVTHSSSFVIVDQALPRSTLLHNTFPNPFPSPLRSVACIWFDLAQSAMVTLDVLDIRTNHVRRIFPAAGESPRLEAGRYGRQLNSESGCDPQFTWDGSDDTGRRVAQGAYLLRMRAGTAQFVTRIAFGG